MPNPEALKLPDPLLVQLYRDGLLEDVTSVSEERETRNVTVEINGHPPRRYLHLSDVGWIRDPEQA